MIGTSHDDKMNFLFTFVGIKLEEVITDRYWRFEYMMWIYIRLYKKYLLNQQKKGKVPYNFMVWLNNVCHHNEIYPDLNNKKFISFFFLFIYQSLGWSFLTVQAKSFFFINW